MPFIALLNLISSSVGIVVIAASEEKISTTCLLTMMEAAPSDKPQAHLATLFIPNSKKKVSYMMKCSDLLF